MSRLNICVITGSRAEFGQLLPLLKRIQNDDYFEMHLVVTGSHLINDENSSIKEIINSNIKIHKLIPIDNINNNSRVGICLQLSEIIKKFSEYFSQFRPDLLIVIGDRYEMFGAAIAASTLLIPIAHLCGGSTTSGAIDEVYRHSITKMSCMHFTTCDVYRKRVIQLGENPSTVFNVGSLAIENCLKMPLCSREELFKFVGKQNNRDFCVVTFHPTTLSNDSIKNQIDSLITALDNFPFLDFIITLSNVDSGGQLINSTWIEAGKMRKNFYVVPSLGVKRYLTALKYSKMMIGNSSSGTTEGPSMGIPTIDIGDRQKGRYFCESVIHCDTNVEDITAAISKGLSEEFLKIVKEIKNPFGDGNTSQLIVNDIKQYFKKDASLEKNFFDINFEVKF